MKKDKIFRVFGIYYFLLYLPEQRIVVIRGDKISSDTKTGAKKTNLKHFKGFEVKKPSQEIIDLVNDLKQKAIKGELDYYEPEKKEKDAFAKRAEELGARFWPAIRKSKTSCRDWWE